MHSIMHSEPCHICMHVAVRVLHSCAFIEGKFLVATPTFGLTTPTFQLHLLLNQAAARKTMKEPVNFLIIDYSSNKLGQDSQSDVVSHQ